MDRHRVAPARPFQAKSFANAAIMPARLGSSDRHAAPVEPELPNAVTKLNLDEVDYVSHAKTPSPPKPSIELDRVKKLLTTKPASTVESKPSNPNTFKRPPQLSAAAKSATCESKPVIGEKSSAVKRIQACSNRLFQTPLPTNGLFNRGTEEITAETTGGEKKTSSGLKKLDNGLLQRLKAFKTTTLPVYNDEDDDEDDANYEDIDDDDQANAKGNEAGAKIADENVNPVPSAAQEPKLVESKPAASLTVPQSYKPLIDKYLSKPCDADGGSKCDFNKPTSSNAAPVNKLRQSKSEPDISDTSMKRRQHKRRSKSKDCSRSRNSSKESLSSRASSSTSISSNKDQSSYKRIKVKGKVYDLFGVIGSGGSAVVYEVREHGTRRTLAVKVVDLSKADESTRLGYENEIQILKVKKFYCVLCRQCGRTNHCAN